MVENDHMGILYSPTSFLRKAHRGLTLVELMVVIGIAGVLVALAAPSFVTLMASYKTSTLADQIAMSISQAKIEALRRSGNVVFAKTSSSYVGSINTCSSTQQWSCGAIVFVDTNGNGTQDNGEAIISEIAVPANVSLLNLSAGNTASLTFNRWGQANGISALNFRITSASVSDADRSVCVTSGGRIRVVQGITCP